MITTPNKRMTREERAITKELFNISFAKCVDALSAMIGEKVLMRRLILQYRSKPNNFRYAMPAEEELITLGSEIRGAVPGLAYLVFSKEDAEALGKRCLPESVLSGTPEDVRTMKEGILLEIDNITTAAVVTQLANVMDRQMYGGVPGVNYGKVRASKRKMVSEIVEADSHLMAICEMYNESGTICPVFYWFWGQEMLDGLKAMCAKHGASLLMQPEHVNV